MRRLLLALIIASPLPAQNLVVNGGFETGDLTGWTPSLYGSQPQCVTGQGVTAGAALTGSFGLTGGLPSPGCLGTPNVYFSQVIATTPGTGYIVSGLWGKFLANEEGPCHDMVPGGTQPFHCSSVFIVEFGPAVGGSISLLPGYAVYQPVMDYDFGLGLRSFSQVIVPTTALTELRITMWTQKNVLRVDNLSVIATPEPSTWAMMAVGLLALTLLARARRTTAG